MRSGWTSLNPALVAQEFVAGYVVQAAGPVGVGAANLNVPGGQLAIVGFTGQNPHHLARFDFRQRAVEALGVRGDQGLGASGVDAESAWWIAYAELQGLDAESAGSPEMAKLMHHDQEHQHREKGRDGNQQSVHRGGRQAAGSPASSRARRLAHWSAAWIASRSGSVSLLCSASTCSTTR